MLHLEVPMKYLKIISILLAASLLLTAAVCGGFYLHLMNNDGGFARQISSDEQQLRFQLATEAKQWLGTDEGSSRHAQIIELYNAHEPLAQGYAVKIDDNWCAAFASAVAISCGQTDIIPTECGCERQVGLWQQLGRWIEDDTYLPLPGDYIYYAWDDSRTYGDCTGWSDHVGIVVGTAGPFIKVIEGNKDDSVAYRIISRYHPEIRGYGIPDFASKIP